MNAVQCSIVLGMALSMGAVAGAQTNPNGMATPPGTQSKSTASQPCANMSATGQPSTQAQVDAGCTGMGPNFATPSTNTPLPEHHDVTAVIRVSAVVDKPEKAPFPMDFQVVGDATMLKAKLPQVRACLGVAKGWTKRTNAATSTTCVDHKGEVLAYQECKPETGGVPMTCSAVTPGTNETASLK
jgi:hypothetical protein